MHLEQAQLSVPLNTQQHIRNLITLTTGYEKSKQDQGYTQLWPKHALCSSIPTYLGAGGESSLVSDSSCPQLFYHIRVYFLYFFCPVGGVFSWDMSWGDALRPSLDLAQRFKQIHSWDWHVLRRSLHSSSLWKSLFVSTKHSAAQLQVACINLSG